MTAPTLSQYQKILADSLLSKALFSRESEPLLAHIKPMFDSSEQTNEAVNRLAIYRNNVILSLSTAIADTFPVVKRLIGADCFNAAAVAFAREYPPEQPSLLFYGEKFIDFIKSFPPCIELSYLADVALLEWNYIRAFHAQDETLMDKTTLQQIAPESLGDVAFNIHPSVQLMRSDWPVETIWEENLKPVVCTIDLQNLSACHLLIYRHELQVQVVNLTSECFDLLEALIDGEIIANAWASTLEKQQLENRPNMDDSELISMLGYLLSLSLFTTAQIRQTI